MKNRKRKEKRKRGSPVVPSIHPSRSPNTLQYLASGEVNLVRITANAGWAGPGVVTAMILYNLGLYLRKRECLPIVPAYYCCHCHFCRSLWRGAALELEPPDLIFISIFYSSVSANQSILRVSACSLPGQAVRTW